MGERTAYNRMNELSAQYAQDPNRHEIDFSSYVRNAAGDDMANYDDPHFNSGYLPLIGNFEATGAAKHTEVQSARTMEEARANVFGTFLGQARQLSAEGMAPKEIAAALNGRRAGQEEFLRLNQAEQDGLMMDVISTLANDGDWEVVKELLNAPRTDEFGNTSTLATSPLYATKTAGIVEAAKKAHGANVLEANVQSLSDINVLAGQGNLTKEVLDGFMGQNPNVLDAGAQVELLTRSQNAQIRAQEMLRTAEQKAGWRLVNEQALAAIGSSNLSKVQSCESVFMQDITIPDGKGGEKVLTVKQQQDQLSTDLAAYVVEQAATTGADPEATLDLEVKLFATAGVQNPRWATTLAGGVAQATPTNLKQFLESGENVLPPALDAGIRLFEELYTKSPLLLNHYFSTADERRFFDLVFQGKKLALDNYQSVRNANQALMNGPINSPLSGMTGDQARSALSDIKVGGFFGIGTNEPDNASWALHQINTTMNYYAAIGGLSGDAAKNAAVEQFKNTHVNINGYYVNVAGEAIGDPEKFMQSVDLVLNEIMTKDRYLNGKQIDRGDISIRPTGNASGEWEVISKGAYAMPLASVAPFDLQTIAATVQRDADLKAAEIEYQQRLARGQAENDDYTARGQQITDLERLIAGSEKWLGTPHYQRAYAAKRGQEAADREFRELPAKIAERKAELERLRYEQTLFEMEKKTAPATPNPSLMQF